MRSSQAFRIDLSVRHWEPLTLEEISSLAGSWNLVPALPWLQKIPALRQAVLGQKAVLALPADSGPLLLLRLPRSRAALGSQRFPLEQVPGSKAWVLALQLGAEPTPGLPLLPLDPVCLGWCDLGWPELHWDGLCLASACSPRARDWAWAWVPTCGPVCLRIYLQRSQLEISRWVEELCPGLWQVAPDGTLRSRLSDDCRMQWRDGFLGFSRGFLTPPSDQIEADYFLLLALAEGGLGELQFDLFDGDYYSLVASGYSAASLREYLHARAGAGKKHRWNRFQSRGPIDARASTTLACLQRLGKALGRECLDATELERHLAGLRLGETDRNIVVLVSPESWDEAVFARLAAAQPRIMFRWQLGPEPPHRSVIFNPGN
ncbi:hypothetical protein JST97_16595 [bacterium]|nr:hypothetical protein [bacterium]